MSLERLSAIKKEKAIWNEHLAFWTQEKEKASDNEGALIPINRELKAIKKKLCELNKEEDFFAETVIIQHYSHRTTTSRFVLTNVHYL